MRRGWRRGVAPAEREWGAERMVGGKVASRRNREKSTEMGCSRCLQGGCTVREGLGVGLQTPRAHWAGLEEKNWAVAGKRRVLVPKGGREPGRRRWWVGGRKGDEGRRIYLETCLTGTWPSFRRS